MTCFHIIQKTSVTYLHNIIPLKCHMDSYVRYNINSRANLKLKGNYDKYLLLFTNVKQNEFSVCVLKL